MRACMADAMSLSNAISTCDSQISAQQVLNSPPQILRARSEAQAMFEMPRAVNISGSCVTNLCEDTTIWDDSCGENGFSRDLERITLSHNLEGSMFAFPSQKESVFHARLNQRIFSESSEDAGAFAIQKEHQLQEFSNFHIII